MEFGNNMKNISKFAVTLGLLITSLLIATTAVLVIQLRNRQAITDLPPEAAVDACKIVFTIDPVCKTDFTLLPPESPENTPTPSVLPTVTISPQCTSACDPAGRNQQCPTNHSCAPANHPNANTCILTACVQNPDLCNSTSCSLLPTPPSTNTPTPQATNTPTVRATNTPINTPTNTQIPPTNTIASTSTPNPTATPNPLCGSSCDPDGSSNQCPSNHTCAPDSHPNANTCILTSCVQNPSLCSNNSCTVLPTPTAVRTSTPTQPIAYSPSSTPIPGSCNANCSTDSNCANNLVCSGGTCRNPECTEQANCSCSIQPTPEIPVTGTGTTLVGIGIIVGGILLLLLGLAF